MIGRLLATTVFFFIVFGCERTFPNQPHPEGAVSVAEFDRVAKKYVGQVISIAGYLVSDHPGLQMYVNESLPRIQEAPIVVVEDYALRKTAEQMNFGEASILEDAGCVDRYAVVTGEVGKTAFGWLGIVRIEEVRVFDGADFTGDGRVCFSSD